MKKPIARLSLVAVLSLLLALCLLAMAGPATAGTPAAPPSFTVHAGFGGELDGGQVYPDCPKLGNLTIFHWRMWGPAEITWRAPARVQEVYFLYDWNMVLLDEPNGTPGWHYHCGTGIICSVDPSLKWPSLPPKTTWLWTTRFAGTTDPAGWHDITEYWTGCNQRTGQKALYRWRMLEWDDLNGEGWILNR